VQEGDEKMEKLEKLLMVIYLNEFAQVKE